MINKDYDFDLIIIGAGPAGSSLALLLPENIRILIVDKSSFPREKICGECLSPGAIDIINELGLEKIFIENHVEKIFGVTFKSPTLKSSTVLYPDNRYGYAIPRFILDKTLIDKARNRNNVTVMEKFTVENVEINQDGVLLKGKTKEENFELRSKLVVGADGRYSALAKMLDMYLDNVDINRHVYVSIMNNVKDLGNTIELEIKSEKIQYLISKQKEGTASIAIVINDKNFDKKNFNTESYMNLLKESHFIGKRVEDGQIEGKLKGIALNNYKLKSLVNNRVLFIGDATGFIDPITGEGMYRAFKTAKFASKSITEALINNNFSKEYLKSYQNELLNEFETIYFFIKTAVFLTSNEIAANTLVNNMNSMTELGEKLVSLQGAIIPGKELFSYNTLKLFFSILKKQMITQST